ncbi:MAG: phosphoribosylamine--glycine ligase [Owenweeksia sp. TMED14]|nr:MAG: phosphoribosylamine--glycine ligase [Owenweeksia sp. TMED14]|tara:strand:+ start:92 stop:1378 length:1287 start_codon:yes stop_codon:yes gene_type:complete
MNVLLFGSGGRESALAWKISKSQLLKKLYVAPGNPGVMKYGDQIDLNWKDFDKVREFCIKFSIDMVIVGPEDPLVKGLADYFSDTKALSEIYFIGPKKKGAGLEGSKDFSKKFMQRHSIPTADHKTFRKDQLSEAIEHLNEIHKPYVLKADGLAGGKGVVIHNDLNHAKEEVKEMLLDEKFGEASSKVVVEEFLEGIEFSIFVLTDGNGYLLLPEAKDYKRIGEGDKGLNTGGMGAVSPVPFISESILNEVKHKIIEPTILGLSKDKIEYVGFIFFGLIHTKKGVKVIEYNCRMGDPETEAVLPRIDEDLLEILKETAEKRIITRPLKVKEETAITVMKVSKGYPGKYMKGIVIKEIDKQNQKDTIVFQAGTKLMENEIVTDGGRVFCVTGLHKEPSVARDKAYSSLKSIEFEGEYYRADIGKDLGIK